jgi:hypothetical protein
MSFWTPDEVELLEKERGLLETGDMNQIWYSGAFTQKFIEKLQYSFYKLGIDMYKGLDEIPAGFYRWTFTQHSQIYSITLPGNRRVHPEAFRKTLIHSIAVPKSTSINGGLLQRSDVEEIYYEGEFGSPKNAKIALNNVRFDHNSLWQVKLEPNYVYAVYQASRDKVRIRGTDGVNPVAWVAFPENLRSIGKVYKVEELSWNGKNYRARGRITEVK